MNSNSLIFSNEISHIKLLIVNDEPFQLMIIQQIIREVRDVEIVTAINGDEAVKAIQENMSEFYQYGHSQNQSE